MNARERFHAIMNLQPFDRLPIVEWAFWWDKTLERWRGEGMPVHSKDRLDVDRHFGLDIFRQDWCRSVHWEAPSPVAHGAGILETMQDYDRLHRYLFQILDEWPVDPGLWRAWADEQKREGTVLWFTLDGFFWLPRTLFGIERHMYAFYDQPDLMHRMNRENAEWMLRIIDRICEFCVPDFMTFAEDMSYNHGPMLSKALFDEFMLPYYQMVVPKLKERGIVPFVDSDGNVTAAAPWFEAAGIEGILPLERQSGVDVAQLRRDHPRMKWLGAFDKLVMNKGEAAMRAEFERLLPVAAQGGLVISCDHQTPPGVSYQDYQLYLRLFREYAQKAGALSHTNLSSQSSRPVTHSPA